jgi:hypothetical protein
MDQYSYSIGRRQDSAGLAWCLVCVVIAALGRGAFDAHGAVLWAMRGAHCV